MTVQIVEIDELTGRRACLYSCYIDDEEDTIFDQYITNYEVEFENEINDMIFRLELMGNETGALENFFKLNEGSPGDCVVALYDRPGSKLRLYCIRYNDKTLILGNGGPKSKDIRTYQQDPHLLKCVNQMKKISKMIDDNIKEGKISISHNGNIIGDLKLTEE